MNPGWKELAKFSYFNGIFPGCILGAVAMGIGYITGVGGIIGTLLGGPLGAVAGGLIGALIGGVAGGIVGGSIWCGKRMWDKYVGSRPSLPPPIPPANADEKADGNINGTNGANGVNGVNDDNLNPNRRDVLVKLPVPAVPNDDDDRDDNDVDAEKESGGIDKRSRSASFMTTEGQEGEIEPWNVRSQGGQFCRTSDADEQAVHASIASRPIGQLFAAQLDFNNFQPGALA